jgi:hypothetical protein
MKKRCRVAYTAGEKSIFLYKLNDYDGDRIEMIPIQHLAMHFCASIILWSIFIKVMF